MSALDSALALARKGFRVFPIPANTKKPVLIDWPHKATTDMGKIRSWFSDPFGEPEDHNIGICCNDLLVIDIEGKSKSGIEPLDTLKKIEAEVGRLHFLVETPSGGYHAYMRLPEGKRAASTVRKLWPGVDSRSWHGFVVADGSTVDGKTYKWSESIPDENRIPASINDLPVAPDWLIEKSGLPKERDETPIDVELDTPEALAHAEKFIKTAKPAIERHGGDKHTYAVAARLRDFAISPEKALDLMLDHWNGRCEPQWDPEALQQKVANAYSYAQNKPKIPGGEFEPVTIAEAKPSSQQTTLLCEPHGPLDLAAIPKREWLIEGVAARGFVTLISAPPGSGKTQLLAQLMLSAAHDAPLAGFIVREPANVWMYNAEDDLAEIRRRIGATMFKEGLAWESRKHDWSISSGVDSPLSLAKWDAQARRIRVNDANVANLRHNLTRQSIGLFILDPFADLHDVPETDNDAIKRVMGIFTQLAKDLNIAIVIATHTRKLPNASSDGHAGNAESVRGASAMVAKARVVLTLMPMSPKEAKAHKVEQSQGAYMRVDTAKNNLGPTERGAKPLWLKWESTLLPSGDKVGVLVPADLVETKSRVKQEAPVQTEPVDKKLAAIADALESAKVDAGQWQPFAPYRDQAAKALGLALGSSSAVATAAHGRYGEKFSAGGGRFIEFKEPPYKGAAAKVRLLSSNERTPETIAELLEDEVDMSPEAAASDRSPEVPRYLAAELGNS